MNLYPVCPKGPIDMILDTDAYNEIDDQFAISYALHASEKLHIRAFCAAPFFNSHSTGPDDGMERSYQEILNLLKLAKREDMIPLTYRGSTRYLPDEKTPVDSDAARKIVEIAQEYTAEKPLYVVPIGAITNVASALLMAPEIAEKIVIVWLGGHAYHWPHSREFNLYQDVAAARVVFNSGAPVVQLPCAGVVDHLTTTKYELIHWLRGQNPLCDYLCDHTIEEAESYAKGKPWSRVIWDISTIAWLLDEEGKMMQSRPEHSPICQYDDHYSFDPCRPMNVAYVWRINRDAVFEDLFLRLRGEK